MAKGIPSITAGMIIEELVDQYPRVVEVFLRHGMHCVGCPLARFQSIDAACQIYQQPLDRFVTELRLAIGPGLQSQAVRAPEPGRT